MLQPTSCDLDGGVPNASGTTRRFSAVAPALICRHAVCRALCSRLYVVAALDVCLGAPPASLAAGSLGASLLAERYGRKSSCAEE
jgi:hypothetical protein